MKTEMKPGRQPPSAFQQSRRLRRPRSGDTERVRALLNRLQTIVPAAPKDRQLPQVQVIQHVINYICQLQHQVVRHPRLGKMVATAEESGKTDGRRTGEEGSRVEREAEREVEREADRGADKEAVMEEDREAEAEPTSEVMASVEASSVRCSTSPPDSDGTPPV